MKNWTNPQVYADVPAVHIPEVRLWRAVLALAVTDLILNPTLADPAYFSKDNSDFMDVCSLAAVDEEIVLYVVRVTLRAMNLTHTQLLLRRSEIELQEEIQNE